MSFSQIKTWEPAFVFITLLGTIIGDIYFNPRDFHTCNSPKCFSKFVKEYPEQPVNHQLPTFVKQFMLFV